MGPKKYLFGVGPKKYLFGVGPEEYWNVCNWLSVDLFPTADENAFTADENAFMSYSWRKCIYFLQLIRCWPDEGRTATMHFISKSGEVAMNK